MSGDNSATTEANGATTEVNGHLYKYINPRCVTGSNEPHAVLLNFVTYFWMVAYLESVNDLDNLSAFLSRVCVKLSKFSLFFFFILMQIKGITFRGQSFLLKIYIDVH